MPIELVRRPEPLQGAPLPYGWITDAMPGVGEQRSYGVLAMQRMPRDRMAVIPVFNMAYYTQHFEPVSARGNIHTPLTVAHYLAKRIVAQLRGEEVEDVLRLRGIVRDGVCFLASEEALLGEEGDVCPFYISNGQVWLDGERLEKLIAWVSFQPNRDGVSDEEAEWYHEKARQAFFSLVDFLVHKLKEMDVPVRVSDRTVAELAKYAEVVRNYLQGVVVADFGEHAWSFDPEAKGVYRFVSGFIEVDWEAEQKGLPKPPIVGD